MCFHGALGYVQIASDLRIVTALKQQIDDLPLPLPQQNESFFHALHLNGYAREPKVHNSAIRSEAHSWIDVVMYSASCIRATNPRLGG